MDDASGQSEVLVASPLDHFIGSSTGNTLADGRPAAFSLGLASTIETLPAGFMHSLIIYSGKTSVHNIHNCAFLNM
eukprot:COSAG05_NODE_1534_length_4616_cov_6.656409_9_plen_76_part_00